MGSAGAIPVGARRAAVSWRHVSMAALLMVATMPGRTQGLGLFTEPILKTFSIDREDYGWMNLGATLLGAAFCLPCGWLLDRFGARVVSVAILLALGTSVLGLGAWTGGVAVVFVFILLTRGFGQSALSVASLALVGRSVPRRSGLAMGAYSCLVSIGFVAAFGTLMEMVKAKPDDWREPWSGIGVGVLVVAALAALLIHGRADHVAAEDEEFGEVSRTLGDALRTPTFWLFALGTAFYGMVAAGASLFNESIFAERGFSKDVFLGVTVIGIPVGLVANLLGGWLATRVDMAKLFAAALAFMAATLATFPLLTQVSHAYLYGCAFAAAGGVVTVCFFIVWRRLFGPAHLGRIQGAAQLLTVVLSAVGPLLFATAKARTGEYSPLIVGLGAASALFAVASLFARVPPPSKGSS